MKHFIVSLFLVLLIGCAGGIYVKEDQAKSIVTNHETLKSVMMELGKPHSIAKNSDGTVKAIYTYYERGGYHVVVIDFDQNDRAISYQVVNGGK